MSLKLTVALLQCWIRCEIDGYYESLARYEMTDIIFRRDLKAWRTYTTEGCIGSRELASLHRALTTSSREHTFRGCWLPRGTRHRVGSSDRI